MPPNPKTNPKPNPNPNRGGQFPSGPIAWLTFNPKTNPHLEPNPNLNWGTIFLRGQLSGYQYFFTSIALLILLMKPLYVFRNRYWFFWSLKVNTKISNYYLKFKPYPRATIEPPTARVACISYNFEITAITLNISTGHRTMSGKKSSYVRQKLLHNGRICPA